MNGNGNHADESEISEVDEKGGTGTYLVDNATCLTPGQHIGD